MNWKICVPQELKNIYHYCRIKQKFPQLRIDGGTRLELDDLDSYSFGKRVTILSSLIGSGCSIGSYSYIGMGTLVISSKKTPVTIGKYCSCGPGISFHTTDHPTDLPSTSHFPFVFANDMKTSLELTPASPITVENDVWIGSGAVITRGVTVGHGAVIGANAVVTKNVEPYSIVGGVPAKLIRKRFSNGKIAELLKTKWWDWTEEEIAGARDWFKEKVERSE